MALGKRVPAYQVGAYYFPNYHVDPRNEAVHGKGWTEWELVKRAEPRFAGHTQPKIPLWGCEDKARPDVMVRKIDVAATHGLHHWIFEKQGLSVYAGYEREHTGGVQESSTGVQRVP